MWVLILKPVEILTWHLAPAYIFNYSMSSKELQLCKYCSESNHIQSHENEGMDTDIHCAGFSVSIRDKDTDAPREKNILCRIIIIVTSQVSISICAYMYIHTHTFIYVYRFIYVNHLLFRSLVCFFSESYS